jgi:hypothetical protein
MRSLPIILAAALSLAAGGLSVAASPPADTAQPGRFTMQPSEGGIVRLDTQTGDVSLCKPVGGTLECKPVKDDRDLQSEIARLATENTQLKAEIKRLEEMLGLGSPAPPKKFELPTEQDVDKALSYLERMFKKFRDKMKDLEGSSPGNPPGGATPERKGTPL